jgi:hypothetical protein
LIIGNQLIFDFTICSHFWRNKIQYARLPLLMSSKSFFSDSNFKSFLKIKRYKEKTLHQKWTFLGARHFFLYFYIDQRLFCTLFPGTFIERYYLLL